MTTDKPLKAGILDGDDSGWKLDCLGEINRKAGAFSRCRIHGDVPIMAPDDSVNRGQSEACAPSHLLGGKERLEKTLLGFRIHADARICNFDADKAAFSAKLRPAFDFLPGNFSGGDI